MTTDAIIAERSPWPHRWALLLCCLTFPLLWVGGLVTTTDAGMAVPDWPGTYGYNMFLYPWETWLFGPWDLFIEHGHRLLASLVGMVTIGLLITVWRTDDRRWLRWLTVVALGLVLFQGILGGVRVTENERLIAMLHGCVGPLFFSLTVALVVLTSRSTLTSSTATPTSWGRLATLAAGFAYLQLTLGAAVRHIDAAAGPWSFATLVKFHLVMALVVAIHTLWLTWRARNSPQIARRLGFLLGGLVLVQIALGLATWLAKYGAPRWASAWMPANMEAITAGSLSQTHTVTAHSATGSLLLGLLVAMAVMAWRRSSESNPTQEPQLAGSPRRSDKCDV